MTNLLWEEEKYNRGVYVERDKMDNHLCDAFLYAYRKAHHFISNPPPIIHKKNSAEWLYEQDHQPIKDPAYG